MSFSEQAINVRKSGFQRFKQITIQSWNEGDIVNWSKIVQRA